MYFQNCLGIIYTAYVDKLPVEIETLVGNIIGCVQAPPTGGPQVRFSIGAGDRQALQPALCSTLPVTRHGVALLFEQIGMIFPVIFLYMVFGEEMKRYICFFMCCNLWKKCAAPTRI